MWIALLLALFSTLTLIFMFHRIIWPHKALRKRRKEKEFATKGKVQIARPPGDANVPDNPASSSKAEKRTIRSRIAKIMKIKANGKGKSSGMPLNPRSPVFQPLAQPQHATPSSSSADIRPLWLSHEGDAGLAYNDLDSARSPVTSVDGNAVSGSLNTQLWQAPDHHINNRTPTAWVASRPYDLTTVQTFHPISKLLTYHHSLVLGRSQRPLPTPLFPPYVPSMFALN
ncbi:hypothetical protein BDP55DRAFT_168143 [Colletotrichum godetiae]|uniref:Uncharacterized protein n=1 Tax=Colletotrichum godetiae TaxID=1209918 RepID=A0AAJ0AKQ4_9PEZI|nr:uncharacterized protein BDP55DRAFT_168143 [Colletotrichum godetiae]KAK1675074.1 hypothetical protein BDP55DRAFT_168143 [Colletotrichum godetiae]